MVAAPREQLRQEVFKQARLISRFLDPEKTARLFNYLWKQKKMAATTDVGGIPTTRKMIWIADDSNWVYYWGRDHVGQIPRPWTKELLEIRDLVHEELRRQNWIQSEKDGFNAVLVNYYENGSQGTDWHSDKDRWLGDRPIVASVSLGATRTFNVRLKTDKEKVIDVPLEDGSLLLTDAGFQDKFHHRVPNEDTEGIRINLTFRRIIPELASLPVEKLAAD